MKYMVMECHPGYAVVLDEKGKFFKVANLHYEVGQMITDLTEVTIPERQPMLKTNLRRLYVVAAIVACLFFVLIPSLRQQTDPYASVYLAINPEVRIDLDRNDTVIRIEGVNADGSTLVTGYRYQKKSLDSVLDELLNKAIEMEFLQEGGAVTLTLEADSTEWIESHTMSLRHHLSEYLGDRITVDSKITETEADKIIIPIDPENDTPDEFAEEEKDKTDRDDVSNEEEKDETDRDDVSDEEEKDETDRDDVSDRDEKDETDRDDVSDEDDKDETDRDDVSDRDEKDKTDRDDVSDEDDKDEEDDEDDDDESSSENDENDQEHDDEEIE